MDEAPQMNTIELPPDPSFTEAQAFVRAAVKLDRLDIPPLLWNMTTDQLCAINGPAPRWLRDMIQRELRNTDG